jgi:hypothetical protein
LLRRRQQAGAIRQKGNGVAGLGLDVNRQVEDPHLKALRGTRTLVGYIYGGIRAFPYQFPYNKTAAPDSAGTVPTRPSELILKMYVEVKRR